MKIISKSTTLVAIAKIGFIAFASPIKWHAMDRGLPPNTISGQPASLTLTNKSGKDVKIYWIKYNGTLQS
ncbi:MAG TPA: hypothetical protein EYG40_00865, partial [Verrucomicrobia bacterium]|nr:hypothetical protein [Verrucomicrobiota bacterium]